MIIVLTLQESGGGPRRLRGLLPSIVMLIVVGAAISSAYNLVHPKGIFRTPPAYVDSLRTPAAATVKPQTAGPAADPKIAPSEAAAPEAQPGPPKAIPAAARSHAQDLGTAAVKAPRAAATGRGPAAAGDTTKSPSPASATKPAAAPAPAGTAPPAYPPATSPASTLRGLVLIEPEDAYASFRQRTAIFVDARGAEHFNLGHIPGAVDLPITEFSETFPKVEGLLPKDARLIVYCEGVDCDEAQTLSWELVGRGFKGIVYFKKGWEAWDKAGYPQEGGAPASK